MTQFVATQRSATRMAPNRTGATPALSLHEPAPSDWHQDRPAYAGDPDMDWINLPEPPREPRWGLKETRSPKS